MIKFKRSLSRDFRLQIPIIIFSVIVNYLWYRGLPIYGGDQGILLANGINIGYLIQPVTVAYTNYPYGFVPTAGGTSWVNLVFIPFSVFGNLGEEILSTILSIIGSIFIFKISMRYYPLLSSYFSVFLYLTSWYIYNGVIEMPFIFWSQTFIYFLLPVIIYYLIKLGEGKIKFYLGYPLITVLIIYLLASSGEIFPIAWLGFTLLVIYFLRKKILHSILIIISYTVSQIYWVIPYANYAIPYFSAHSISNSSLTEIISESSTPLVQAFSSFLSSVTNYNMPFFFTVLVSVITLISILVTKNIDIKILSLLFLIIIGFDSVDYTPFFDPVKYAVLHSGFFAVLRTTQFATATFAGVFFSLITPSITLLSKKVLPILLIVFLIFNFPILSGSLADRINPPNYFLQAINYLNSQDGNFTIVVFPTIEYGWYITTWYYGNNVYLYYSKHPVIVGGIYSGAYFYNDYYNLNAYIYDFNSSSPLANSTVTYIYNLLLLFNAKYIVIEGDAYYYKNISFVYPMFLPVTPYIEHLNEIAKEYHFVSFVKHFGPIYIYKVNINSSYAYYTNTSNINFGENLSKLLKQAPIKWISNTEIQIPQSNYKYVLLTFAYSPYWYSSNGEPINISNFDLYYSGGKSIIIYNTLQSELVKDNIYGILSILIPIILGFVFRILNKIKLRLNLVSKYFRLAK